MEKQAKKKKSIFRRWWFWVLIVIFIIGIAGSTGGKNDIDKSHPASEPSVSQSASNTEKQEPVKPASKVTYENFLKVAMGAKLEEVNELLGEGTETSSSEVGGVKTAIYSWSGPGISNLNVTIQNGIVTGKAQAGLQSMDAKVTMEKYNKIKSGMTYDQVKEILGEGQLISETELMGTKDQMYEWINSDGANMNITFQNGKVDTKTQFELK